MKKTKLPQGKNGQMNIVNLFVVLIIVGALGMSAVLVHSKLSTSISGQLTVETSPVNNESVTITMVSGSDNSTLLAQDRFIVDSEAVKNATDHTETLVKDTDYSIVLTGTSGEAGTKANLTLLTPAYNITDLKVSYDVQIDSEEDTTFSQIEGNSLDSYELGSTGMIILAVSVIITIIGGLGAVFGRR